MTFKERVRDIAINESKSYKRNYVDYEYLIYSDAFKKKEYYIIDAKEDNYQHLIGVNSLISAQQFFDNCYNGTLQVTDFNFCKHNQTEKSVKGSVRRKIKILSNIMELFSNNIKVEEDFSKNQIICSIATADNKCTLGFIDTSTKARPKTLLKGNELNEDKMRDVKLLLRKKVTDPQFNEIIIGNNQMVQTCCSNIKNIIHNNLFISNQKIISKFKKEIS